MICDFLPSDNMAFFKSNAAFTTPPGLGWIYVHGLTDEETWFYVPNLGWLATTKEVWSEMDIDSIYLWLYHQDQKRWIAYVLEEPEGKTFWDPQSSTFFTID